MMIKVKEKSEIIVGRKVRMYNKKKKKYGSSKHFWPDMILLKIKHERNCQIFPGAV